MQSTSPSIQLFYSHHIATWRLRDSNVVVGDRTSHFLVGQLKFSNRSVIDMDSIGKAPLSSA
jgi:hypothetical protein